MLFVRTDSRSQQDISYFIEQKDGVGKRGAFIALREQRESSDGIIGLLAVMSTHVAARKVGCSGGGQGQNCCTAPAQGDVQSVWCAALRSHAAASREKRTVGPDTQCGVPRSSQGCHRAGLTEL